MKKFSNSTFEAIWNRSAVRAFSSQEIPEALLVELLELANRAPSGFNLQPWHFILVRNEELRQLLKHVAMDQTQVAEAPSIIVFAADPNAWRTSFEKILQLGQSNQSISEARAKRYRRLVRFVFRSGPLGLFGLAKKIIIPIRRLFTPTPVIPTSFNEAAQYMRSQTMLSAATFMIAAKAAGLDTSPLEGFDEERLKKLLALPKSYTVPIIIAVGYAIDAENPAQTVRLPLEQKLSLDLFPNRVKEIPKR